MLDATPAALVTGGSRGIGESCVAELLSEGYQVVFSGQDADRVGRAQARFEQSAGNRVAGVAADVVDPESSRVLVAEVVRRFGGLDVVVANAGVFAGGSIEDTADDTWRRVIDVNLSGTFWTLRAALPELRKRAGYAIAIGSVSGARGWGWEVAYGASKRALRILTESIRAEAATDGVRATLISPGVVRTNMSEQVFGKGFGPVGQAHGLLSASDVAATVAYLLRLSPSAVIDEIVIRDSR